MQNSEVEGTSLKKVPSGYDPEHPQAELFKFKSWFIEDHFEDKRLDDIDAFIHYVGEKFLLMEPFNDYLNRAQVNFKMPERN